MPTRAPVDELVRVEKDDPQHDRERDDRHGANVPFAAAVGPVFDVVLSHSSSRASDPVNLAEGSSTEPVVTAALSPILPFASAMSAIRPHMIDDIDTLVRQAAAGDPAAFRALFARHKSDVARLVYRMLNAPADLDDVVQEVFVQVFRSLKDFRGQSKFSTWLHRVTVNVVLMHRRSARSRPVLTEELPGELVADDGQTLPDEDVERLERMRAFQRLLARLADKKRVVFVLHELEGMTPAQIAEVVGAPVLTVRTRLFYARRELEAMLAEEPTLAPLATSATREPDPSTSRRPHSAKAAKEGMR